MKIKTNKSAKLRDFICIMCKKPFQNRFSPSDIKKGRGKTCSFECKHRWNGITKRKSQNRICKNCGNSFLAKPSEDRRGCVRSFCSRFCQGSELKERKMSFDGYWIIHVPIGTPGSSNGDMKEHRYIMQQHIGRNLLPKEIVHHINENKLDNRLENLAIMSRSEHNKLHFTGTPKKRRYRESK